MMCQLSSTICIPVCRILPYQRVALCWVGGIHHPIQTTRPQVKLGEVHQHTRQTYTIIIQANQNTMVTLLVQQYEYVVHSTSQVLRHQVVYVSDQVHKHNKTNFLTTPPPSSSCKCVLFSKPPPSLDDDVICERSLILLGSNRNQLHAKVILRPSEEGIRHFIPRHFIYLILKLPPSLTPKP